ncbi:MAG: hypothetical protein HZB59_02420 [Ignavibacteriales bacterium]|nr:hypothetical protein [Ignavibacteriales bacterium]
MKRIAKKSNNKSTQSPVKYCTECGEVLDNYCFSSDVNNIEEIKQHHEQCKITKKFNGDVCSRLFIAEPVNQKDFKSK